MAVEVLPDIQSEVIELVLRGVGGHFGVHLGLQDGLHLLLEAAVGRGHFGAGSTTDLQKKKKNRAFTNQTKTMMRK